MTGRDVELLYWRKFKERLRKEGNESVTNCHVFKLLAVDTETLFIYQLNFHFQSVCLWIGGSREFCRDRLFEAVLGVYRFRK